MEEEVHDEDVEHVLQRVDHAVEDGLQLGHALDRLQWPEHAQHAQRLHRAQLLTARGVVPTENRGSYSDCVMFSQNAMGGLSRMKINSE